MTTIGFDALTAAVTIHHIETRRHPRGLIAQMLMEAAVEGAQISRHGVRVTIKGWSGRGDPVIRGGDQGTYTVDVKLQPRDGLKEVRYIGQLSRRNDQVVFDTSEMGLDGHLKLMTQRGSSLRVQVRQRFPDVVLAGLGSLVGRPLCDLVGHPGLETKTGRLVTISAFHDMDTSTTSRIGMPGRNEAGFDVEVQAPLVEISEKP